MRAATKEKFNYVEVLQKYYKQQESIDDEIEAGQVLWRGGRTTCRWSPCTYDEWEVSIASSIAVQEFTVAFLTDEEILDAINERVADNLENEQIIVPYLNPDLVWDDFDFTQEEGSGRIFLNACGPGTNCTDEE